MNFRNGHLVETPCYRVPARVLAGGTDQLMMRHLFVSPQLDDAPN